MNSASNGHGGSAVRREGWTRGREGLGGGKDIMIRSELFGVIGATGKTGTRVVDRLEKERRAVRRLARGTAPAFDWTRPHEWAHALRDVSRLYVAYVPDLAVPGSAADIQRLLDTARATDVDRIVLLSGRGEAGARAAEDLVLASGIASTVVRAAWFSQNFTEGALAPGVSAGVIAMAAGGRREPFVDVDDIADVAVAALTGDGHIGEVCEVTGPELLSFADAAQILSEVRGHPVEYLPLSLERFHTAVAEESGAEAAHLLTELCREVFDGRNESLGDGVLRVLGRRPRSLRDVASAAAAVS